MLNKIAKYLRLSSPIPGKSNHSVIGSGNDLFHSLMCQMVTHKQLLRFTDYSIEHISETVGMEDAGYFARDFKKIEGISPSEYRKQW